MLTDAECKVLEDYLERPLIYSPIEELNAVYSAMVRKGEWDGCMNYANMKCGWKDFDPIRDNAFNYLCQYIFCLNAPKQQIGERLKMVVEFLGRDGNHVGSI